MIKYNPETVSVVFSEVPDFVSLAIEITNCPGHCVGCHSPWLREDIGEELTIEKLDELIEKNKGVNCVVFMGEGRDPEALKELAKHVRGRETSPYVTALYSGRDEVEKEYDFFFDYIKIGPYIEAHGPLNKETTNQRFYEVERIYDPNTFVQVNSKRIDITNKFWKKDGI